MWFELKNNTVCIQAKLNESRCGSTAGSSEDNDSKMFINCEAIQVGPYEDDQFVCLGEICMVKFHANSFLYSN